VKWFERQSSWDAVIQEEVHTSVWDQVAHDVRRQVLLTDTDNMWLASIEVRD
jgi:hypothetical protein